MLSFDGLRAIFIPWGESIRLMTTSWMNARRTGRDVELEAAVGQIRRQLENATGRSVNPHDVAPDN